MSTAIPDLLNATLGIGFLVAGGWLLSRWKRAPRPDLPAASAATKIATLPLGAKWVMDAGSLLQPHAALSDDIIRIVGLPWADWKRMGAPLLDGFAGFCQRLPASEAHHHAHPGGLLEHSLDVATRALRLRQGLMLPPGADAEDISRLKSRWSYAVLVAALLHDIGKPISDLAITCGNSRSEGPWHPLAGSLPEQGMDWYRVAFVRGRSYALHQRLAVLLLQKLVPAEAIAWLSAPGGPMRDLMAYLSGEAKGGALAEMVTQADRQSVAANLMEGPRVRFASARDVPLVERLMAGLRSMLAEGLLPLNRDGAAGFVKEGSIWLVCKRTADELREYLQKNELAAPDGAPGLPSSFKNDRIFDTFQEYGALTPNPATGGAVWTILVSDAGWSHSLTMLRFPLEQVYPLDKIPSDFPGSIKVAEKKTAAGSATAPATAPANETEFTTPSPVREAVPLETQAMPSDDLAVDTFAGLRALIDGGEAAPLPQPTRGGVLPQRNGLVTVTLAQSPSDDGFLDEHEALMDVVEGQVTTNQARRKETAPTKPSQAGRAAPAVKQPRVPSPQVLAPVVPHTPAPPRTAPESIPENAKRLMAWIQEGIGNGTLVYNVPGALIHFVEENSATLMLLVSPRIFRHYLDAVGESATGEPEDKIGALLQKDFFKAGWHRAGPKKMNILRYRVKRRNSEDGSLLSVVVIPQPERFVNPVPPPNPHIVAFTNAVHDNKDGLQMGTLQ
ncbi:MAG: TraI domain-containing protein [Gammaproteobacteria bacterium]|nr:TraI domain-containing protein [Gammaproteobacteria bacterium]